MARQRLPGLEAEPVRDRRQQELGIRDRRQVDERGTVA
jgi:hypothetical protein